MNESRNESKLIFKPHIARRLLKMGARLIDIKADRENKQRTIFVFERNEDFDRNFDAVINDIADERVNRKSDRKETKE